MGPSAAPCFGSGDLLPSLLRIELLRVTPSQDLECFIRVSLEIDRPLRVLMSEPVWRDKIRNENTANLVAILVVLDGIANFTGPEDSLRILVGTVEPRVNSHLAEFMSGANTHARVVGQYGLDEDFGDRQTLVCEVVEGQRAGLSAIIEEYHPPTASSRRLTSWNESELGLVNTPDRPEIVVPLLSESRQHRLNIGVRDRGG